MITTTQQPTAFTLIETVISLAIMSILLLGLSGAVMIGSKSIPSSTQSGITDQTIILSLNNFRNELQQATRIQHRSTASGEQLILDIKDTGAPGTPSSIRYRYIKSTNSFTRTVDAQTEQTLFTNIDAFDIQIATDDSDATIIWILMVVNNSIQRLFELNIALPDKPELT